MDWVWRILVVLLGFVAAMVTSGLSFVLAAVVDPILQVFAMRVVLTEVWKFFKAIVTLSPPAEGMLDAPTALLLFLIAPPLIVGLAGELFRIRSFLWYSLATAAFSAIAIYLLPAAQRPPTALEVWIAAEMAVMGCLAGLMYWAVAGRSAGR